MPNLPEPYYSEPGITVYHADCRDILPLLPKVDLVLTDPPYGIDHPTDYASRKRAALAPCQDFDPVFSDGEPFDPSPLLTLDRPTVLWGANHYASRLPDSSGWLVWDKERPDDLDQATCELAWTNFVKGVRRFRHLWNGMIRASERTPLQHPTAKPVALMLWVLTLPWTPEGLILDPYCGAGPVLVAAKMLGRRAIGIEIEERYCEIAARRIRETTPPLPWMLEPKAEQMELAP